MGAAVGPSVAATIARLLWLVICAVFVLTLVVTASNPPIYLPVGGATASLALMTVAIAGAWTVAALAAALMLRTVSWRRFVASALLAALLAGSATVGMTRGDVPLGGITGFFLAAGVLIAIISVWAGMALSREPPQRSGVGGTSRREDEVTGWRTLRTKVGRVRPREPVRRTLFPRSAVRRTTTGFLGRRSLGGRTDYRESTPACPPLRRPNATVVLRSLYDVATRTPKWRRNQSEPAATP
jgi:hypothetical protein